MLLQPFASLLLLLSIFSTNTAVLALSKKAEIAVIASMGGLSLVVVGGVLYCRYNRSPFKRPMLFRNAGEVMSNPTYQGLSLEEQNQLLAKFVYDIQLIQPSARWGMNEKIASELSEISRGLAELAPRGPSPQINDMIAKAAENVGKMSKTPIARNVRAPAKLPAVRSLRPVELPA